jgi:ligand-binding sensor domain-containing protein/two-component sensor histidine kinase
MRATSRRNQGLDLDSNPASFTSAKVDPIHLGWNSLEQCIGTLPGRTAFWFKSRAVLCLCVISSLFLVAQAQEQTPKSTLDPNRLISQYGHTAWQVRDGVVRAYPYITQTADGYIWMSNRARLLRFDGAQFVTWQLPKGAKLPSYFSAIFGASDGSLWIGTRRGLSRLKNGELSTYTKPSEHSGISTIIEDHAGKIWLTCYGTSGQGGLCEVAGQSLRCYGKADGLPTTYGLGFTEDLTGNLWIAGQGGLFRWKPGTQATRYLDADKQSAVIDVAVDHSGNVWAAMDETGPQNGVRYFHNGVWGEYTAAGFHSSALKSHALYVDRAGAVWIGTENDGIYRVWRGAVDHFSKNDGLSGHTAGLFYEDREGNLWVTTDGGVDLFRNTPVITYSMDEGLNSDAPSLLVARDGTVWAGNYDGNERAGEETVNVLQPGSNRPFSDGPKLPGRVRALFQDHSGALWLGLDTTLAVYEHGRVERVFTQDGHVFKDQQISAIVEDSEQTILALDSTSLFRIRDRHVVDAISLPKSLSVGGYLAANPSGGTWIAGQREGLMLYQNGAVQSVSLPFSDEKRGPIHSILADSVDPLLLATSNGLLRWDGKRWQLLDETNGLPCQLLSAIKDRRGSLWLQSDCGLLEVDALELQKWRQNPESRISFTVFDDLDGARPGSSFVLQPMMSLAPDGRVWYSNGHTIQVVDPDQVYKNPLPPPVHVEQLVANGKPYQADGQSHIPPNPRNLEIDYTGLSFIVPQKVQFRYFLEGHDKTWQGPVTRRQAFYTDLRPGTYRFHVVACNNSGVWNDTGAESVFVVEPTFYQTLWFKALIALAVAGLLWGLYLLRLKKATANVQERLLVQVEERERIARELHDTLLQGFQGITLRMQGVAKNMPIHDPLRKMTDDVLDRADQVLREARSNVRNLRRRTTDENELLDRLTKCGEELSKDHAATFTLAIVGEPKVLGSTVQDEAYRIAGEALTNAFRHASASKIETEVAYDSSALRIRVRDDGVGIPKTVLSNGHSGHWGLTGMRERARAIRAELNIWSREAAGTEVELVVPASIAYPREQTKTN